jgi:Protein of unknown function (DUF3224)
MGDMPTAAGTFDLDRFDDQPPHDDRDGVSLARAHITKTFHGDLAGTSETDIMTVHTDHPAAYVGIERFDGTLHGRKGGFVLQHSTGTGELAGIRGEGQIVIGQDGGHSYTLDYEL